MATQTKQAPARSTKSKAASPKSAPTPRPAARANPVPRKAAKRAARPEIETILAQEHREVTELLERIIEADGLDAEERLGQFAEFRAQLLAHSLAEARVFYAPIRVLEDEQSRLPVLEAAVEHEAAERLVEDLSGSLAMLDPLAWKARAQVLLEMLRHHIEEEEGELFELANRQLEDDELAGMASAFMEEKTRILEKLRD